MTGWWKADGSCTTMEGGLADRRSGAGEADPGPGRLSGSWIALALGGIAFAQITVPTTAQAQCSSSSNPSPPPVVTANFSNQTFGAPPLKSYGVASLGLAGCIGADGGDDENGFPGSPGQPGGQITGVNKALTLIGGGNLDSNLETFGAIIVSQGGVGGAGGQGGYTGLDENRGGIGGAGGAGGNIAVSFDGTFVPDPKTGLATYGLYVSSAGAEGGRGGDSNDGGIFSKNAGAGGPGGAGGSVALTASGSVQAEAFGVSALSSGGSGGNGGNAASIDKADDTNGGHGGDGGQAGSVSLNWLGGTVTTGQIGLLATADGGIGGAGGDAAFVLLATTSGGNGGAGGNGGTAMLSLSGGEVTVNQDPARQAGAGLYVSAIGGAGGHGGTVSFGAGEGGGSGGNGGTGGAAGAAILGSVAYSSQSGGQGVLVQSNGGAGGPGAGAGGDGQAGGGGFAGAGGGVTLFLGNAATTGTVRTSGTLAHGAVVQSVGGAGGTGGNASFFASAGAGAAGGDGGPVVVQAPNGSVIATGKSAIAMVAQSVGGGGGVGGDTNDISIGTQIAIGGNGGLGGNGGAVNVDLTNGVFASTSTLGGAGILAQSIGGSGGAGGSAASTGVGFFSMTIGGDAGGGGGGGLVNVTNKSLITSYGDHAAGIQAQSIGGGGGKGGSAFTFAANALPTAAVAVGGRGGSGGPAGDVAVSNTGQVTTYGADATGILIQSIGGGGGTGGAAAARAVDLSPSKEVPAISISVAMGGKGGAGNTGGQVALDSNGLIATAGDGAIGVMAQSVGGGGGTGGDSTAASYSGGPQAGVTISLAVAVGGAGGTGGTGGAVTVWNDGLVATRGQDAYGVFAQSVGGGGGAGGAGDASSAASKAKGSFAASIGVGGTGGTGGHADTVDVTSTGAVTTVGDGSDGVFAQSVGGGGGAGGGGVATAGGGNLSLAVGVGGSGGAGGNGNTATVTNGGSIVTRGTDAIGLSVQSIGGGGGKGGKGGATAGGSPDFSNAKALFDILANGLGLNQTVTNLGDGILRIGQIGQEIQATYDELNGIFSQPQAGDPENGTAKQMNVSVSVGGSGGAAGDGGAANATNTGGIATSGAQSDGIYAQSVGGGGGSGGAATSTSGAADDTPIQTAIGVGRKGGGGGTGGVVTVVNEAGAKILTQGVAAFGIMAHSVGGGGGEGSLAGTVSGSLKSLSVGIGGDGGPGGNGGAVGVTTDGAITTTGKHGIAIFAQSVGGGGGLVRTMTTDETFDPSKIVDNPQGRIGDVHGLTLALGGKNGIAGNGGDVSVATGGPITTSGLDAHGILAQSIGGGGGMAVGGQIILPGGAGGPGGATGNGGNVAIQLNTGTAISTAGDGAYGIIAQSIGGGGGFAGDPSAVHYYQTGTALAVKSNTGNGGDISIAAENARIQTTGAYAPAIFAQSIGGGGGMVNYNNADGSLDKIQARGTAGGDGSGGAITISLVNSRVQSFSTGSSGIFAQSDGGLGAGKIKISIDSLSEANGGKPDLAFPAGQDPTQRDAAAIRLMGGVGNEIDNAGGITAAVGGIAILTDTPSSNTQVTNTGTISGDIVFNSGTGNVVDNRPGGVIEAFTAINLSGGQLRNAGTLQVGGAGAIGRTTVTGDLVQSATGRLVVETNHSIGTADLLDVQGHARLGGMVEVHPVSLANRAVTVLSATEGLAVDPGFTASRTHLYRFDTQQSGGTLQVQPVAEFSAAAGPLGRNQRRVAAHLQQLWDSGAGFDEGFTALAGVGDGGSYARALSSLSGQTVGAVAALRYSSSHGFVTNMLDECATFEGAG
ncbi:beta strand repeat-containing protein, partial [Inquilinus sp. CA228]|uniref:beta strand repeat-containing protein n=1 Tax=Inquilinus sp. CA228 TaxID=3455609 RepID=UPI003F8D891A